MLSVLINSSLLNHENYDPMRFLIANQCAPVIKALKPANLFVVPVRYEERTKRYFKEVGISVRCVGRLQDKKVFFVYQKKLLHDYLQISEVETFLRSYGYGEMMLSKKLQHLAGKLERFYETKEAFPHEIGLFLGYPVEDVAGYIKNQGRNFHYSGYWKVYGNVENARIRFKRFDQAREELVAAELFYDHNLLQYLRNSFMI